MKLFRGSFIARWNVTLSMHQVQCPFCGDKRYIILNGRSRNGDRQMYRCKACHKRFTGPDEFLRHRFPAAVIRQALRYLNQGVSYRGVKFLLWEYDAVKVSATTIYRWHKKFSSGLSN